MKRNEKKRKEKDEYYNPAGSNLSPTIQLEETE